MPRAKKAAPRAPRGPNYAPDRPFEFKTPEPPRTVRDVLRDMRVLIDELDALLTPRGAFVWTRPPTDFPEHVRKLSPHYRVSVAGRGIVAVVGEHGGYIAGEKVFEFLGPVGSEVRVLPTEREVLPGR